MTNHLDNVCIMQKYNDSEKVLELRKEFQESEEFINKAVNEYDNLKEGIDRRTIEIARQQAIIDELVEVLKAILEYDETTPIRKPYTMNVYKPLTNLLRERAKQVLKKASE